MKLKQTLMLALLGALPAAGLAQRHVPLHGPERLFEEGKELFIKKDYAAALHALSRYVETARTPSLPMLGEAEYMMACTAYELKDEDCVAILQRYLDTHADSPYKNRVGALMADALFYQGDYAAAVDRFRAVDLDLLGSEKRYSARATVRPVSSRTSRATPSSPVSSMSMKPPGRSSVPRAGSLPRRHTSSSPRPLRMKATVAALELK